MARPTKLTPELQEEILGYIKEGMYIEPACALAHVTRQTYHNWKTWGEEGGEGENAELYREFFDAATHAEAVAQHSATVGICDAADVQTLAENEKPGDWRALAWFLERRFPALYGKRIETTVQGGTKRLQVEQVPVALQPPEDDEE